MPKEIPNNLDAIVHIGAGKCQELEGYLATSTKRIILVEPIPALAEALRKKTKSESRVEVIEIAIGDGPENTLYQFNLVEASSLYLPIELKKLFPGIKTIQGHSVVVKTAESFIESLKLEGSRNGLVLQVPGAESLIINALDKSQKLDLFSFIKLTGSEAPLYSSNNIIGSALELVEKEGYELDNKDMSDPDWICWQFSRNPLQQPFNELTGQHKIITELLSQAQADLQQEKKSKEEQLELSKKEAEVQNQAVITYKDKLSDVQKLFDENKSEYDSNSKKLNSKLVEANEALEKSKADHSLHLENFKSKLTVVQEGLAQTNAEYKLRLEAEESKTAGLQKILNETQAQLEQSEQGLKFANQQLESNNVSNKRFEGLEEKLIALSSNITDHMDKRLLDTSRQLESFIGLQGYLEHGDLPVNPHGTSMNSALALMLVEKIETNNYDLIIEFGSGASTALLAKAVLNKTLKAQSLRISGESHITPNNDDLPKRVVTFEHKKDTYKSTQKLLSGGDLQKVVELVHAPLVDYTYKDEHYLYYACDTTLSRVANMLEGRAAKILVLIDGPPQETGAYARFPALPKLLNNLSTHNLHLLIDNCIADDDQHILETWRHLLTARSVDYVEQVLDANSGTVFLALNEGD